MNCLRCNKQMDVDRENSLCGSCNDDRIVRVQCPSCKQYRNLKNATLRKMNGKNECRSCANTRVAHARYKTVHVLIRECKDCGKTVKVLENRKWLGRCDSCRRKYNMWAFKEKRREEREKANPRPTITVNGCVLVKADSGRCKNFIHCLNGSHANINGISRERDCCYQIAKLNWPGWKCV